MEWALLALFILVAAVLIGLPRAFRREAGESEFDARALREEHGQLMAELRDLDDDASAGRISAADRRDGRRALAPRLRAVSEALREAGERVSKGAVPREGRA